MTHPLQSLIYYGVSQPRSHRRKVAIKGRGTDLHCCTDLTVLQVVVWQRWAHVWRQMTKRVGWLDKRLDVEEVGLSGGMKGQLRWSHTPDRGGGEMVSGKIVVQMTVRVDPFDRETTFESFGIVFQWRRRQRFQRQPPVQSGFFLNCLLEFRCCFALIPS